MKQGGEKMGATAMCGVPVRRRCAITSIITHAGTRWSKRCSVKASRESWALTSTPPTMSIWACINAVGCICYATATSSKSSIPRTAAYSSGPRTSKRSMSGPSPTLGLIRACLQPSKRAPDASINTPSSRNCGSCARPTRIRLRPCILYVSASNASCLSCSSSWRSQVCQLRTTSPSAACVHSLLHARSVGERGVQRAVIPAWVSSVSLARGPLRDSIRSCNALPSSPKTSLYHKCEQYLLESELDISRSVDMPPCHYEKQGSHIHAVAAFRRHGESSEALCLHLLAHRWWSSSRHDSDRPARLHRARQSPLALLGPAARVPPLPGTRISCVTFDPPPPRSQAGALAVGLPPGPAPADRMWQEYRPG